MPIRILIVEDNPSDAEMILRLLHREAMDFEAVIVGGRQEYISSLDSYLPDLIISDNSLPGFSATEALDIYRQKQLHIPFILVTGTISEDFAVNIMKQGADDYILKDRLARLPAAVEAALHKRRVENERRTAIARLVQSEENLKAIFDNTSEGFVLIDGDGIIRLFNERGARFGLLSSNTILETDRHYETVIAKEQLPAMHAMFRQVMNGEKIEQDRPYERPDGIGWLLISITPVFAQGRIRGICITGKDITERKLSMARELDEHRRISRAVLKAQENERTYIGQELHDNINQILVACKIHASHALNKCPLAENELRYTVDLIDKTIDEIRVLCRSIVTPPKDMDLEHHLNQLLETVRGAGIQVSFDYFAAKEPGYEIRLGIYRLAQEQLHNIIRHAKAGAVSLRIYGNESEITLQIDDDGCGFDPGAMRKGVGLTSMINRVESFHGTIDINSSPGHGCHSKVVLPLRT